MNDVFRIYVVLVIHILLLPQRYIYGESVMFQRLVWG